MWKNTVQYNRTGDRRQYEERVLHAAYLTLPKQTHSDYVIRIAFPLQLWLHERPSMLHYTYIACLAACVHNNREGRPTRSDKPNVLSIHSWITIHRPIWHPDNYVFIAALRIRKDIWVTAAKHLRPSHYNSICRCRINSLHNNEPDPSTKYVGHLHKSIMHQDTAKRPVLTDTDTGSQSI
jgi:hypothetical protein